MYCYDGLGCHRATRRLHYPQRLRNFSCGKHGFCRVHRLKSGTPTKSPLPPPPGAPLPPSLSLLFHPAGGGGHSLFAAGELPNVARLLTSKGQEAVRLPGRKHGFTLASTLQAEGRPSADHRRDLPGQQFDVHHDCDHLPGRPRQFHRALWRPLCPASRRPPPGYFHWQRRELPHS